jgi:hypothetical protein
MSSARINFVLRGFADPEGTVSVGKIATNILGKLEIAGDRNVANARTKLAPPNGGSAGSRFVLLSQWRQTRRQQRGGEEAERRHVKDFIAPRQTVSRAGLA